MHNRCDCIVLGMGKELLLLLLGVAVHWQSIHPYLVAEMVGKEGNEGNGKAYPCSIVSIFMISDIEVGGFFKYNNSMIDQSKQNTLKH